MATNAMSLLPGRNPAGTTIAADYSISPAIGSTSGANPFLTQPNLPSGAPLTNPYDPSSVVPTSGTTTGPMAPPNPTAPPSLPTFGANTGGYTSGSLLPGGTGGASGTGIQNLNPQQLKSMQSELSKTYGSGTASAIMQFLQGGAGFNQQSVNNLLAALQPGYNRAQENLIEQFSTSGNRFGSGAQIGLADLQSQEQLNIGQIESQMYQQSIQDYIGTLMGAGQTSAKRIASSPSAFDWISMFLGAAQSGASDYIAAGA
jgi:hypothetical protein